MKRWFNVFFVFMLLFALSACGKNDDAILNKQDYMSSVCTKDSVNEFITAAENIQGGGLLSGYVISEENCYNVTPAQVAIETNIKIFKLSDSCASFVMIDNEIYSICESFGGYGFVNAVPCDFDNDGNKDLLVASSWGSGFHRSIVSIFNTSTRESTVVYDTSTTDTPHMDMFVATATPSFSSKDPSALPVYYQVYSVDIKVNNNNFADLSYVTTGIIGTVEYQNGSIVFKSTNSEK